MICIGYACDRCNNRIPGKVDGWMLKCKAFPDGIPTDMILKKDPEKLPECNNGIGFQEKVSENVPDPGAAVTYVTPQKVASA